MNKIKLSIVIPVWNQEELICRSIKSVPDREDIEVIVVNDGSTDRTKEVIEEHREEFLSNFTYLELEENQGVANALNLGLKNIKGDYYMALGSDDYLITSEFNKFVDTQLDGTDMVYFNLRVNDGSLFRLNEETYTIFVGSTKAYRTEFIKDITYPRGKRALEDITFDTHVRILNPTIKFTDMTIKHYNWPRENSLTYLAANDKIEQNLLGRPYAKNKKKQITKTTNK